MGEILARLLVVLTRKGILSKADVAYIFNEEDIDRGINQAMLTSTLIMNGIFTEEDLKKVLEGNNDH